MTTYKELADRLETFAANCCIPDDENTPPREAAAILRSLDAQRPTVDGVMEQAQVFASAWALVGSRFVSGTGLEAAEQEKKDLRTAVEVLAALQSIDARRYQWLRGRWLEMTVLDAQGNIIDLECEGTDSYSEHDGNRLDQAINFAMNGSIKSQHQIQANSDDPDNDCVICPNCVHQFRAIPVNVQSMLLTAGHEPPFYAAPVAAQPPSQPVDPVHVINTAIDAMMRRDATIAGVLFDFMGRLTTRKERLCLSSADDASPAVTAITEFAKMRNLSLDNAMVTDWQFGAAQASKPLSDDETDEILDRERIKWNTSPPTYDFSRAFARAIVAAFCLKNGIKERG